MLSYVRDVQPSIMERFAESAPPAVVAAMRSTITNMLGTLPPQFFTVTISTAGENLAQLMSSVLLTGYLFAHAQQRMDLHKCLAASGAGAAATPTPSEPPALPGGAAPTRSLSAPAALPARVEAAPLASSPSSLSLLDEERYAPGVQKTRVQGEVLMWHKENGVEAMDAAEYIGLLEAEVLRLRADLAAAAQQMQQQARRATPAGPPQMLPASGGGAAAAGPLQPAPLAAPAARPGAALSLRGAGGDDAPNELLDYLRSLEPSSLADLTGCASAEVGGAMDAFVARLLGGADSGTLRRAHSECSAQELGRLLFWLCVVGFSLRQMEAGLQVDGARGGGGGSQGRMP